MSPMRDKNIDLVFILQGCGVYIIQHNPIRQTEGKLSENMNLIYEPVCIVLYF